MALSSAVLAPEPTPIARTVMPASRAFFASEAVSGGLLDWPSVTMMATLGTLGLSPDRNRHGLYNINFGTKMFLS